MTVGGVQLPMTEAHQDLVAVMGNAGHRIFPRPRAITDDDRELPRRRERVRGGGS
jgi:hypothetical protein